jgi:hypothetical protein
MLFSLFIVASIRKVGEKLGYKNIYFSGQNFYLVIFHEREHFRVDMLTFLGDFFKGKKLVNENSIYIYKRDRLSLTELEVPNARRILLV